MKVKMIGMTSFRSVHALYMHLCFLIRGFLSVNSAAVQAAQHHDSTVRSGDSPSDAMSIWRVVHRRLVNKEVKENLGALQVILGSS